MDRKPPYDEDAERGALGAMLLDPSRAVSLAEIDTGLKEDAFYVPAHRMIYRAILDVCEKKTALGLDVLTVSAELEHQGNSEKSGGLPYLHKLIDDTPSAAHALYYLEIVRQKWVLRKVQIECLTVGEESYEQENGDVFVATLPDRFMGIIEEREDEITNVDLMEGSLQEWRDAKAGLNKATGLPTPWDGLTEMIMGLETGMTILAARPSQGKTTMEGQISSELALAGIPVGRVTMDSSKKALLQRDMCRLAGVSLPKLKWGYAGDAQIAQMEDAKALLADAPMYFSEKDWDLRQICSRARRWKMKHDIQLLTIDFIQLCTAEEMGRNQWDTNSRVGLCSKTFKALSFELDIPVLVLSQLNRSIEKDARNTKEGTKSVKTMLPQLSDLRDSGSLEQDAEKVIFIYKDIGRAKEMEEENSGSTKKLRPAWAEVMKHKDGETGSVPFLMRPHYFRFGECGEDFQATIDSRPAEDMDVEV